MQAQPSELKDTTNGDESAGAKIWGVYISEAEKYDTAIVERWRSDMEGILIFAGLFSASLTAFLIESYRTLSPDQGQLTVLILTQISHQLAAVNGSAFELPTTGTLKSGPGATALACNVMWFTSLCLSLSCAFMATLVEQWARDFIGATKMHPSPIIRARIFSYLYYGIKRFSMHSVVELIPLLLHTSLVLFFAGLVAFLHPVNSIVTNMAGALLAMILVIYFTLTILPMIYSDCPYRTPLSIVLWRMRQGVLILLAKWFYPQVKPGPDEESSVTPCYQPSLDKSSMVEVMTHHATQKTAERDDRDQRALVWTVKSLADDDELEPFVEGISAVLWGARGRRKLYDERIMALVYHPEVLLASRIETLLRDCNNGLLPAGVESRRQISSLKALWAMARLSMEKQQSKQPLELFDLSLLEVLCKSSAAAVRRHAVSTHALVQYSTYRSVATGLREVIDTLADSQNPGVGPPSIRFSSALKKIERQMVRLRPSVWLLNSANINYFHGEPPSFISPGVTTDTSSTLSFINEISDRLRFLEDAPGCIFLKFLENSADVDSMPYEFLATCSGIRMAEIPSSSVERTLERIISTHSARLKRHPEIHHIDSIVGILLSLWKPESPSFASTPWIVEYLTSRDSDECLSQALQNLDLNVLRSCIKAYLQVLDSDVSTDNILEAIWRLCVLSRRAGSKSLSGAFDETMLLAVQQSEFSLCSPAVIALIQCDVLDSLVKHPMETLEEKALLMAKLKAPILPARATPHADDPLFLSSFKEVGGTLNMRYTEAGFTILTDFLDGCRSDVLPFHARDTLQYITAFIPRTKLHASHQLRFASSLLGVVQVNTTPAHTEMIAKIIHSSIFDTYARRTSQNHSNTFNASVGTCGGSPAHIEYLDDPDSRRMLTEALRTYAATLPPGQFPTLVSRITAVLSKITISPSNNEPPRLQAPNSRRDFFHTLGVEYRVLRPT